MIRFMFNRAILAASVALSSVAIAPANVPVAESGYEMAVRHQTRHTSGGLPVRRFPSKGKQARPKKRRNMNHVSRRVRRAHRRSRAA